MELEFWYVWGFVSTCDYIRLCEIDLLCKATNISKHSDTVTCVVERFWMEANGGEAMEIPAFHRRRLHRFPPNLGLGQTEMHDRHDKHMHAWVRLRSYYS